jgi:aerobic C4-dicarboxylate transport protein
LGFEALLVHCFFCPNGLPASPEGFVVLAATLASPNSIPVASLAVILGVFRFIPEGGAIANTIGHRVATIVAARWNRELA